MTLSDLTLIPTPVRTKPDATRQRRTRLCAQIDRQIDALKHLGDRRPFRGRWWVTSEGGQLALSIKYGKVPLELAKGKHAIQCDDADRAIAALEKIRHMVVAGEFDEQLKKLSDALKERLNRGKAKAHGVSKQ